MLINLFIAHYTIFQAHLLLKYSIMQMSGPSAQPARGDSTRSRLSPQRRCNSISDVFIDGDRHKIGFCCWCCLLGYEHYARFFNNNMQSLNLKY